jgi:hypothetical protein
MIIYSDLDGHLWYGNISGFGLVWSLGGLRDYTWFIELIG